jgi:hypothetical protein
MYARIPIFFWLIFLSLLPFESSSMIGRRRSKEVGELAAKETGTLSKTEVTRDIHLSPVLLWRSHSFYFDAFDYNRVALTLRTKSSMHIREQGATKIQ